MCGIAGFTGPNNRPTLTAMTETLRHRGPDGCGYWEAPDVSLGMRRLAIIDVETGQQPVFNEDGTVAAVFNGEIYNYIELREQLARAGHRFSTDHCDSEVIVHLYEDRGLEFLHELNGMFAIALWDARRRWLVLARDRLGIKPLYLARVPGGIAFGSEPKALLAHPAISPAPNLVAIHHYLSLKNVPAPLSAFRDVEQVRSGELVICAGAEIERRRWWRIGFDRCADVDEGEAAARIRALLEDSVRLQMRADVPYGAYLSGGVDSSSVVALLAKLGAGKINTFTLVYDEDFAAKQQDREFARAMARRYGTDHHEHRVTFADLPEKIDHIVRSFDEPFSGVVSTYFITESISRHVKVALSGDGADEMFGSYLAHRIAGPLAAYAAGRNDPAALAPFQNELPRLAALVARGDEAAQRMGLYLIDDAQKSELYSPAMREATTGAATEHLIRALLATCRGRDPLNRALMLDQETLLPDQVLAFVDRLSMAHSVEVRPPFLDHRLVEFVAALPGSLKIRAGRVKHILKEAVTDLLPPELLARPKEGFIMPVNHWMMGSLKHHVLATLAPERLARHGLFRPDAIRRMLEAHYSGATDFGNRIWNLLMLQLWWERYVG
jgi:asparagine synthase (glutamine-hydrolysing)